MKLLVVLLCVSALISGIALPVMAAGEPTVTILEYRVNPSVLMPESLGTITITVKNTATSATLKEIAGIVATEPLSTKITDINVNIENVHLEGNGITVLSNDFATGW